jgi:quinol-cytochrome oxidoreductase complex cytochrome b subunit
LMDVFNSNEFSLFDTPLHIVPEWYFLLFYAILRSIPIKSYGMACIILIFILLL